jgi:glucose-6-phosphate-specific signal transduction histidine kinase
MARLTVLVNLMSTMKLFYRNNYRGGILDFLLFVVIIMISPKTTVFLWNLGETIFSSPTRLLLGIILGLSALSGFIISFQKIQNSF